VKLFRMKRHTLLHTLTIAALMSTTILSCKKENGIDNETVIKKPYGLYITSEKGELLNTNDGDNYTTVFPVDGYATRSLVTSSKGIVWLKANLFVSLNNGKNFNPKLTVSIPPTPGTPWQTILLSALDQDRIYAASTLNKGIYYSDNNGDTWSEDAAWDNSLIGGGINSFTQLKNGVIYAHADKDDSLYRKNDKNSNWTWVQQTTPLAGTGTYYINHFDNTLVATDVTGANGVYYSNDGQNWNKYNGLPTRKLYSTNAPFDQVLLVGTDSMGIYRLQSGQFVASNNGMPINATVFGIIGKDNVYKNGARKQFIYAATDQGLYRSEDLGQNWVMVKTGNYRSVY